VAYLFNIPAELIIDPLDPPAEAVAMLDRLAGRFGHPLAVHILEWAWSTGIVEATA
jgi:hypothetical protein